LPDSTFKNTGHLIPATVNQGVGQNDKIYIIWGMLAITSYYEVGVYIQTSKTCLLQTDKLSRMHWLIICSDHYWSRKEYFKYTTTQV